MFGTIIRSPDHFGPVAILWSGMTGQDIGLFRTTPAPPLGLQHVATVPGRVGSSVMSRLCDATSEANNHLVQS